MEPRPPRLKGGLLPPLAILSSLAIIPLARLAVMLLPVTMQGALPPTAGLGVDLGDGWSPIDLPYVSEGCAG